MLQIIYGRAGTGKTEYLMQDLCRKVQQGRRVMLLVPEQSSFESEKSVYRRLGGHNMMGVEVLSFTRLANLIFQSRGGAPGRRLDEPTRLLLMAEALEEVSDRLELYAQSARNSTFLQLMCQTVSQFKQGGVTPEKMAETARELACADQPQLGRKLKELALVYEVFQALVDRSYTDPLDDISRAGRIAAGDGFFSGWDLYIDGFIYFTGAQLELLKVALEDCGSVTAAFCGLPGQTGDENSLFYSSLKSAAQLRQLAQEVYADIAEPVVLQQPLRFAQPGIAAVEQLLCGQKAETPSSDGVRLVRCGQPYDEVEYVAAEISALVREQDLRYRDVMVVCRDMERYRLAVESVFARYDLPLFWDDVVELRSHPFATALLSALEAVRGNLDTAQLLNLAKTPVFGLDVEEAALLENYCFVWSVEGKDWEKDFTVSPKGLQGRGGSSEAETLARLNLLRQKVMAPLAPLRALGKQCGGEAFARACYAFLDSANCVEHMRSFCDALPEGEQKAAKQLAQTVWNDLMELLDVFAATLKKKDYPFGRLVDLLQMALGTVSVGQIPSTLDQVGFVSANRVLSRTVSAVFLLGANEGVFPARPKQSGIFSEKECRQLQQGGLDLYMPTFQTMMEERFFFYRGAACASRHLCVTAAAAEATGEALEPSAQFLQLAAQLSGGVEESFQPIWKRVVNLATAEEELARHFVPDDPFAGSIAEFLTQKEGGRKIELLYDANQPKSARDISPRGASALFGRNMKLSASQIESFYRCPFRYFCRYGLKVEPLRRAEFSPLESGSAIHYVLEQMVLRHGGKPLADLQPEELKAQVVELMNGYLNSLVADPTVLGDRKLYLFGRMVDIIVRVLQRLGGEFAQSLFLPAGVEVRLGDDAPVAPLRIQSEDGAEITVVGSIDRVDLLEEEGKKFVRVIDYKSGGKKFDLSDVYYGMNMQMLIYLFALCDGGKEELAGCDPAGILYFPAKTETLNLGRETDAQTARAKQGKNMSMNGLLLEDLKVLEAMDRKLSGEYISVKLNKNGSFSAGSLTATGRQFGQLKKHVYGKIGDMGDSLRSGRIAPDPADGFDNDICRTCDYRQLCRKDRDPAEEPREKIETKDFYTRLEEKGGREA